MFAEAMELTLNEEYQAWNYMAADNTKQIGGYLKKFDRLSWITVKGPVQYRRYYIGHFELKFSIFVIILFDWYDMTQII